MKSVKSIYRLVVTPLLLLLLSAASSADDYDHVLEHILKLRPDFEFESVEPTSVQGIYKASIVRGPTLYIAEDGKHFFVGDFFLVGDNELVNIAEQELEAERRNLLANTPESEMIIFPAANKKAHIYVFTDVDCYYCQKLHREMAEMNELGIEVRYLAFPRAGINSPSYRKIATAWCAKDPNAALTDLKAGKDLPENVCENNPVAKQFDLGGRLGVNGTPALVTDRGMLIPGYKPADELAKVLGISPG